MNGLSKEKQYHIMCNSGDLSRYLLIPGDPDRVQKIASFWDEAKKADIWVMHSKIPVDLRQEFKGKIPEIAVVHGPAEHMILQEWGNFLCQSEMDVFSQ